MAQALIPGVVAYVLAGGRSSRMGRDKAMLTLGGRTLLARAVQTLRNVASEVVLLGDRPELEGADRAIADLHPGCGPLGGMETALRDLTSRPGAEWACFLPVDMPFLPAGLYAAMLRYWLTAAASGARIGYVRVDGVAQPLVSLIHGSALPCLEVALEDGRLKVAPALEEAAKGLASKPAPSLQSGRAEARTIAFTLGQTNRPIEQCVDADLDWSPSPEELAVRQLWFANLNTPQEFDQGETLLRSLESK
jgi:molybdenum cofactor guanylyltransferase